MHSIVINTLCPMLTKGILDKPTTVLVSLTSDRLKQGAKVLKT